MLEAFLTIDKLAEAIKLLATNGITIRIEGLGGFSGIQAAISPAVELPVEEVPAVKEKAVEAPVAAAPESKRGRKAKAEKQPTEVETPNEKAEAREEGIPEEQGEEDRKDEKAEEVAEAVLDDLDLDLPAKEEFPKATIGEVREGLIKLREKHGDVIVAQVFQRCGCKNMRDLLPESFGMALAYAKTALKDGRI